MRAWLMNQSYVVTPQSKLSAAISYAQKVFNRAIQFADHLLVTSDTNRVENAVRPFVVGQKNRLFTGNVGGAYASADLYNLIETAGANGHEPYAYPCPLFERLPTRTTQAEQGPNEKRCFPTGSIRKIAKPTGCN
ncbi:MAG: IS66 family transposase [Anaerolineae bacterium]